MKRKSKFDDHNFCLSLFVLKISDFFSHLNLFLCNSEAIETRHALHGIRWPTSNPKCLNVDFGNEGLMEKALATTADEVTASVPSSRDDRIASSNSLNESTRERVNWNRFSVVRAFVSFFLSRQLFYSIGTGSRAARP